MLALPSGVARELDQLVWRVHFARGTRVGRGDLVAGLILVHAPEDAEALFALAHNLSHPRHAVPGVRRDPLGIRARDRLTIRLPSPLSHRLNELIARIHDSGRRASRAGLVAGLVHSAPSEVKRLLELCAAAREWPAERAALAGDDPRRVLSLERPRPGPRPGLTAPSASPN